MKTKILLIAFLAGIIGLTSCTKEEIDIILNGTYDSNVIDGFDCSAADTLQSLSGTPALYIKFENRAQSNIKVEWINFQGELQTYKESLEPGDDYSIQSFQWHYWKISDADGDCIGIYAGNNLWQTNVITFQEN